MKRILALTLALILLLCGCAKPAAPDEVPPFSEKAPAYTETAAPETTEATEPPTEAPTEPRVYYDPLNGEILDGPYTGRIFASTVADENDAALPHVNTLKADILIEVFANNNKTRCLALFSDPSDVEAIGSTRSTRLIFNDIVQHYDAVLSHAGGSSLCIQDANDRELDHYNVDSLSRQGDPLMQGTGYRDKDHPRQKYGDANLYAIPAGVKALAESQGVQVEGLPEKEYGLTFAEDGTPENGQDHSSIIIRMVAGKSMHENIMVYNAELDKYVLNQYGREMTEFFSGEPEAFQNVVIAVYEPGEPVHYGNAMYHTADFTAGGTGYYANGGKMIPLMWTCESEDAPFFFWNEDGTPLVLGQGNTYMALVTPDSQIVPQ